MLADALDGLIYKNNDGTDKGESMYRVTKLISAFSANLRADCFTTLQEAIGDIFTESTVYFKSPLEVT